MCGSPETSGRSRHGETKGFRAPQNSVKTRHYESLLLFVSASLAQSCRLGVSVASRPGSGGGGVVLLVASDLLDNLQNSHLFTYDTSRRKHVPEYRVFTIEPLIFVSAQCMVLFFFFLQYSIFEELLLQQK